MIIDNHYSEKESNQITNMLTPDGEPLFFQNDNFYYYSDIEKNFSSQPSIQFNKKSIIYIYIDKDDKDKDIINNEKTLKMATYNINNRGYYFEIAENTIYKVGTILILCLECKDDSDINTNDGLHKKFTIIGTFYAPNDITGKIYAKYAPRDFIPFSTATSVQNLSNSFSNDPVGSIGMVISSAIYPN